MPVVHIDPAELAALGGKLSDDPAVAKLYELLKGEAEGRGGATLAVWKLHMARLWGEPLIMTSDEVAKRLRLPVSDVAAMIAETKGAVREDWMATPEYRASRFAEE
jgi:hypothetical protein